MDPASRLITTPFDADSTADDVLHGIDLSGVRAIVTGASSGLGRETARALAAAGAEVTMAVRNLAAGEAAADEIANLGAARRPGVAALDLADQDSVSTFVEAWEGPLHLLVNNAGLVTGGLDRTADGWELQFATNHLGHFALSVGLHRSLAAGAADRDGARIVSLSSTAHMRANIDFDDLHFLRRPYDPQIAYAQAKTANSLFSVEATRRSASDGIVANTVNPGGVATGLQRNFTPSRRYRSRQLKPPASSPIRPSSRAQPQPSSPPSGRNSHTPAATTWTTHRRRTRSPTMPNSPTTRTRSRPGPSIRQPPNDSGPSPQTSSSADNFRTRHPRTVADPL